MNSDVAELGGRDPHGLLGVPRGASSDQVARAFRERVKRGGHPDTGGDAYAFRRLVRARDVLLDSRRLAAYDAALRIADAPLGTGDPDRNHATMPTDVEDPESRSAQAPPPGRSVDPQAGPTRTSRMAIATVVLALLCPALWPVAIVTGHLALRQIRRTGQGGTALVSITLLFLYVLSVCVLPRILLVVLTANTQ